MIQSSGACFKTTARVIDYVETLTPEYECGMRGTDYDEDDNYNRKRTKAAQGLPKNPLIIKRGLVELTFNYRLFDTDAKITITIDVKGTIRIYIPKELTAKAKERLAKYNIDFQNGHTKGLSYIILGSQRALKFEEIFDSLR